MLSVSFKTANKNIVYQFYIELKESNPLVWRRIIVPAGSTFYQLHMAIQGAFGWENSHLFQFSENGFDDDTLYGLPYDDIDTETPTIDARKVKFSKILKEVGRKYVYIYDFGDGWNHELTLEGILDQNIDFPYCLDGRGACPPEDVGGIHGYNAMVEILNSENHPEKESYIDWLGLVPGERWDAAFCSIREVNKRLVMLSPEE